MAIRTLDGDAAVRSLHARHGDWIRRYLSRIVGEADADDLTQDVFERAQRALAAREGPSSRLGAWLYRTATNAAVDWMRSRAVREREDVAAELRNGADREAPRPDREMERARMRACILGLVERLPPSQRAVVLLAELRGLSDRETAEALGVSLGAAKIRRHRARRALRGLMECECRTFRDERNEFACEPRAGAVRVDR